MGEHASFPAGPAEPAVDKIVNELYFSPRNLMVFFDQYTQKQLKPIKTSPSVETAIFPMIIEQILLYQSTLGKLSLPANFEGRIFDAIARQIGQFIVQANPFAERFRYIEDLMQNRIQTEQHQMETDLAQQAKLLRLDDSSAQSPVVIQASFSLFFDLVPKFDQLASDRVESLLDGLLQFVCPPCPFPDSIGASVQLLSEFKSFLIDLALSAKFATTQIKSKVISFLLYISPVQGGISTVFAALTVGITVNSALPFDGSIPSSITTQNGPRCLQAGDPGQPGRDVLLRII
jgi:hypothetical protein